MIRRLAALTAAALLLASGPAPAQDHTPAAPVEAPAEAPAATPVEAPAASDAEAPAEAPAAAPAEAPAQEPASVERAAASDDVDALDFGSDAFRAGGSVIFDSGGAGDVFLAGERVRVAEPVAGAAHLAGRRVEVAGAVGGNLYAMGADVGVDAPVGGNATLAGYDVGLRAPVGGNLRATGSQVVIAAPVGGAAIVSARSIELSAAIDGDAALAARTISLGEGAQVGGTLTLYESPEGSTIVPESVAPAVRIVRLPLDDAPMLDGIGGPSWVAIGLGVVLGALSLTIFATIIAALAPRSVARLGLIVADGPFRALGAGFLTQAALIGGAILFAVTVIGLVIAPFALLASVVVGLIGYVIAVYLLGVWAVTRAGALEPDTFPEYALTALVGAVIASLLTLLPFVGWLASIVLTLIGVGAMAIAAFSDHHRPA